MERVLNQDERIRRAEEIYARRRQNMQYRTSATVNVDRTQPNNLTKKLLIQFVVCLLIYSGFYAIKKTPNIVSQDVMYKIADVLEYDINIQELYSKFNNYINKDDIQEQAVQEQSIQEEVITPLPEETLSATDNTEDVQNQTEDTQGLTAQDNIENTTTQVNEATQESSSLSQMEIDSLFIKSNYSLIKPLEGEITSRFGPRNPTVPTVPKYHTGIDIARVVGTVIVASMEGDVTLVSSEGDYGNHVKITSGEVDTLYAHCSKIYVKEGEHIVQGQAIAEVGATGNVTGPHLHFEIRRNNQYVDPDLILQF